MVKQKNKNILEADISFGKVTLTEKALFAKHLSVMLKAGLTIVEALEIAVDSSTGKLKRILKGVKKSIESGQSLSSSLARYPKVFSGIFISTTYAGETSGTLANNLDILATRLEKEKELVSKVKGAMLYPIVILIASLFLGLGVSFFILPKIIPLFEGLDIQLPITTRALIWFSYFIQNHGTALIIGLVIAFIFLSWLLKQKFIKPLTHLIILKTPIIHGISHNANIARFTRTLGTLLKSGLNIDEALNITKDTLGNYYFKRAITNVSNNISKGSKLSDNLIAYPNLFPIMVVKMIKVGEESGKLEEVLLYLARFYEVEVDNSTKSLSTAIEPILLIFIGLIVGFLAISIITPIYNITGNIQR